MSMLFAETLKSLRMEKEMSQRDLAERIYVTRSAIAKWENGSRLPTTSMISRISEALNIDINIFLSAASQSDDCPNVIMVDDRKLILTGGLPILEEALPEAIVTGFTNSTEAIEYAKANRVALAFLDIELRNGT